MNANELLQVSKENEITVPDILSYCMADAKNGRTESIFQHHFSTELISELANKGFRVSQSKGHIGERIFIVSWN